MDNDTFENTVSPLEKTIPTRRVSFVGMIVGFLLALVIGCFLLYFFAYPIYTAHVSEIETLSTDVANVRAEKSTLEQQLRSSEETILSLEREMTQYRGQLPGENLLNANSIFKTVASVDLYELASSESSVVTTIDEGVMGEVKEGPRLVNGEVWWSVSFRDGAEGWTNEQLLERVPSTVLSIDEDEDGVPESRIRLVGTYDRDGFVVEPQEDSTNIRYQGEPIEPYDVTRF